MLGGRPVKIGEREIGHRLKLSKETGLRGGGAREGGRDREGVLNERR